MPATSSLTSRLTVSFGGGGADLAGQEAGRITFHLFDDVTPKTAANFRALSCGLVCLALSEATNDAARRW